MTRIPIDVYSVSIPAATILFFLIYSFFLWQIGDRVRAKHHLFNGIQVIIMIALVGLLFTIANYLIHHVFGIAPTVYDAWNSLGIASAKFDEIYRKCVDWILAIAIARAEVAIIPYISPLSDVIGSATMWEVWSFSFASTTFLALKWFAVILTYLQPWLLGFGAALTVSDRLRLIGGGMLAILLVMGPAVTGLADYVYANTIEDPAFNSPPHFPAVFPPTIAASADPAANIAIHVTVFSIVVMAIAGLITAGISSGLGSVAIMLRPI